MSSIKMYAIFARETLVQMKYEGKLAARRGTPFFMRGGMQRIVGAWIWMRIVMVLYLILIWTTFVF